MNDQERLLDLLASRATEGLSEERSREFDLALRAQPGFEADGLELAAAAAYLAFESASSGVEAMPEHLKQSILEQAQEHLGFRASDSTE